MTVDQERAVWNKHVTYRIWLTKEPEGGYAVTVPSLPGCVTYGESVDEAVLMAREAIQLYIESLEAHGESIPTEDATFEYTPVTKRRAVVPFHRSDLPKGTAIAILKQAGIDKDEVQNLL